MPGIVTNFKLLDLVSDALSASPDATLQAVAGIINNNKGWAYFGAVGANLADFIPATAPTPGKPSGNQYLELWKIVFSIAGGNGTEDNPGLFATLSRMNDFLDRVEDIALREDLDDLKAMESEIDTINEAAAELADIVADVQNVAIPIGSIIEGGMRPSVCAVPDGTPAPPPEAWTVREFLHWKRPGLFAQSLIQRAQAGSGASGERLRAYAYGYLTSYVAKVCGSPFINSIVGGPYRTQWYRHRWINNFVDAWVHGFYEAGATISLSTDEPTPPYDSWPDLCNAALHEKFQLAEHDPQELMDILREGRDWPATLPDEFTSFWIGAYSDAYGPPPAFSHVQAEELNAAYHMTWLVLWFQTSGDVIGCNPVPPPEADCGDAPSWTDLSTPGDADGSGVGPPPPAVETVTDTSQSVSGWILAILGGLLFLGGGFIAGAAAIAGGIALILTAVDPNWEKLRCDIHWYRWFIFNGLQALHEIMVLGGIAYPYARELGKDQLMISLLGIFDITFDSGVRTVRSQRTDRYPGACWSGTVTDWINRPTSFENPQTQGYHISHYPDFFLSDSGANPLANGRVAEGSSVPYEAGEDWPLREKQPTFGNAVENALDLLKQETERLPDWNLDGDRGQAWFTWRFADGISPHDDPVSVERET